MGRHPSTGRQTGRIPASAERLTLALLNLGLATSQGSPRTTLSDQIDLQPPMQSDQFRQHTPMTRATFGRAIASAHVYGGVGADPNRRRLLNRTGGNGWLPGRPPLDSGTYRRLGLPSCVAVIAFPFLAALVIFLDSRDAPTYSHTHVSRIGKPFRCLKFRAMFVDAEERLKPIPTADPPKREEWGRSKQTKEDLLATRVRNFLRRTNLDQLPRIFKAFHGSMSVVGWRPLPQYHYHGQGESFRSDYPEVTSGIMGCGRFSEIPNRM